MTPHGSEGSVPGSWRRALKVERVNRTAYPTKDHARKDVVRYIEFRYNTKRLHSALGYRTPREAYNDYQNHRQAA
jgi:putative transposase